MASVWFLPFSWVLQESLHICGSVFFPPECSQGLWVQMLRLSTYEIQEPDPGVSERTDVTPGTCLAASWEDKRMDPLCTHRGGGRTGGIRLGNLEACLS